MAQLPLSIAMDDTATFDNFYPRESARGLLAQLCQPEVAALELYIGGGRGVGKSHLLQATCQRCPDGGVYLPLAEMMDYPPDAVTEGLDHVTLLAVDDVDAVLASRAWQEALFHLFNRRRDAGLSLLFAGRSAPATYTELLPDLRSRLASLTVFNLPRMDEQELSDMLQYRASLRGIQLSDDVLHYILGRAPRSSEALMQLLDRLDTEALARSRAITIPLINELKVLSRDR